MKKISKIFTFSALLILAKAHLTAQENRSNASSTSSTSTHSIGIKAGGNLSNFYSKDVTDNNLALGFHVGVFAEFPIASQVSFMPELLYTLKGASNKYDNAFATGEAKFTLGYIEMPLLLKFKVMDIFSIHGGGYVGYLVNSSVSNVTNSGTFDFQKELNSDNYNRVDAGISAGVGLDFDRFGVGARYNYGLTTIGKERQVAGVTYTIPDSKNSVFNLYATLKF